MSTLPPFLVPAAIGSSFPQLIMLQSTAVSTIEQLINNSNSKTSFLNVIEEQGAPSSNSGWARLVDINPEQRSDKSKKVEQQLVLSTETIAAFPAFISPVLVDANNDVSLKNLVWTVQSGTLPSLEEGLSSIPNWSMTTLNPQNGVEYSDVTFKGDSNSFSLKLRNQRARHLGIYVEFYQGDKLITPNSWSSRLPKGVSTGYESETRKYLGLLKPTTAVAGIDVSTGAQKFDLFLPSAADRLKIVFGGIGNGRWQGNCDAAGTMLSYVLDMAVPIILAQSKLAPSQVWFDSLLADSDLLRDILKAGEFLLDKVHINSVSTALAGLSEQTAKLLLSSDLSALTKNIDQTFGADTVENGIAYVGWPAQTLKALLDSGTKPGGGALATTTCPMLAIPPSFEQALSPNSVVDLMIVAKPDPNEGSWPQQADRCEFIIRYGAGFSQQKLVNMQQEDLSAVVEINFGSVRSAVPITVTVHCLDISGQVLATGSLQSSVADNNRQVPLSLAMVNVPITISSNTVYQYKCKLGYSDEVYSWNFSDAPTAVKTDLGANNPLSALVDISLQQENNAIGYTWQASDLTVGQCGIGGSLTTAYFFQNIGNAVAEKALKTISCGFAQQPGLVYLNVLPDHKVPTNASFFLDPRNSKFALRAVDLSSVSSFNLEQSKTAGRFVENNLTGLSLHPSGYAVATSWADNKMEILALSDILTDDSHAERANILSGKGVEAGLIDSPVGSAITPDGFILVLEDGNKRIQAFNVNGDPTSLFNGSPYLMLKDSSQASYLDITVSPAGLIYVLFYQSNGSVVSDYQLDLYQADGTYICRSSGINGARLEVDSQGVVYTLNYESIIGHNSRTEPSISQWLPTG